MKKISVITSSKAKDHVNDARIFMEEMKNDIAIHRNNLQIKGSEEKMQTEERQNLSDNRSHEKTLALMKKAI